MPTYLRQTLNVGQTTRGQPIMDTVSEFVDYHVRVLAVVDPAFPEAQLLRLTVVVRVVSPVGPVRVELDTTMIARRTNVDA